VGPESQKCITELRYVTFIIIVFCRELIWIVKVEIVGFFWYFAKLYQFMGKYDNGKSWISRFSDEFLIFGAYSRDYEGYNKIVFSIAYADWPSAKDFP